MKNSVHLGKALFLTITVLFTAVSVAFSQEEDEQWKRENDRGNRYEGGKPVDVGNPPLVLLSFLGMPVFLPSGEPPDLTLKVKFFLPDLSSASIVVRELKKTPNLYWMEAKETKWDPQRWNDFTWPTKDVLRPKKIPLDSLGIVVRLGGQNSMTYVPAIIFNKTPPEAVTSYRLYLRPARNLHRVTYTLFKSGAKAPGKTQTLLGEKLALMPFSMDVDASELPEGWVRLKVTGSSNQPDEDPVEEYNFYHKPLQ